MSRRKPGLSRDEHTELGAELHAMHGRLGEIAVLLSQRYTLKLADQASRAQTAVDQLRSDLDSILFDEYPGLSSRGNASVYYPGATAPPPERGGGD